MTDRERLTALLMAGAGDFISKNGALNCTKLAEMHSSEEQEIEAWNRRADNG